MKLKHYLMASYLFALLAPIVCCIVIFILNRQYNYRTELKDYLATSVELSKYEEIISDSTIYTENKIPSEIRRLKNNDKVLITLYNNKGITLYSTITDNEYMIPQEYLYQNLNQIQYGGTTYTLKKPVFNEQSVIVGFYEISIPRANLRTAIMNNMRISVGILFISVVIIFLLILKYLDKRFNNPIKDVIQSMNEYAKGNENAHVDYSANDEIGELCKHFNAMKDEIEVSKNAIIEEQKAKEYMIATISHDLKTPLTAIRAYAEMLEIEDNIDKVKVSTYLETILGKCDYMKDMLDDLLTYNLLSMNYQLSQVEVEGQEFSEMLLTGIDAQCNSKKIILNVDIDVNGTYKVDVKYMTRVVDNIVSNAIRHTPVGGHIWAGAFSTDTKFPDWLDDECRDTILKFSGTGMFLVVKNEGNVISQKDKDNLFKPFYQGDEARSKKDHKGVGLGLSISKMIMEKHKGYIEAVPVPGVGTAMICFLNSTSCKEEI